MENAKDRILELVGQYHRENGTKDFVPGTTPLLASGAVLDETDRIALVEAALDMRIAAGVSSRRFERDFARYFGLRKAHLTNSGSSANLVALSALTSPQLGDRRLRPGDEVVTVAAERVRLAMPTRAKTAMTMIAAFSTRPGVTVEAGAAERVRWPGTTEMRVRGARSTARSGYREYAGWALMLHLLSCFCFVYGGTLRERVRSVVVLLLSSCCATASAPRAAWRCGRGGCALSHRPWGRWAFG